MYAEWGDAGIAAGIERQNELKIVVVRIKYVYKLPLLLYQRPVKEGAFNCI